MRDITSFECKIQSLYWFFSTETKEEFGSIGGGIGLDYRELAASGQAECWNKTRSVNLVEILS